jgi:multiple antibiotic resistance protein
MDSLVVELSYVLSTVIALLPIVNPLAAIALVLATTKDLTGKERNEQILRACIYMVVILVAFLVAGGLLMGFFGISIPGLRIAGGLIVTYLGFRMLFPDPVPITGQERKEAIEKEDISFTPLAMPTLSGPGSIAVVVGLSSTLPERGDVVVGHILVVIGIAITALISYLVLRASTRLHKVLGTNGINAVSKVMGFLLICIGVQFAIDGILEIAAGFNAS